MSLLEHKWIRKRLIVTGVRLACSLPKVRLLMFQTLDSNTITSARIAHNENVQHFFALFAKLL
jgi:hypothetical protein